MADSESIQDRLLSIFPLESPDGDFSVQLVEVDREADQEVRVVFRVVHWNVLPDGLARPPAGAMVDAWVAQL